MKKVAGYKIDAEILREFNISAKENALNKSQWLENIMKEFVKNSKKSKNK